ncbi:meiotic cell cortex C-terminal pleckstrin homology-domain-containing protein [Auriculariales sp. MPI-PUGE-AT-0066]|nr:meiotic cell cortex C-terminal pleckstrin homology-domain-containing protein [Auriculariales sp. MPI-PUGE-AT-0066]
MLDQAPPRPTSLQPDALIQRAQAPAYDVLLRPTSLMHNSTEGHMRQQSTAAPSGARLSMSEHGSLTSTSRLSLSSQRGVAAEAPAPPGPDSTESEVTDPAIIHAITQTMISEFLYKYTSPLFGRAKPGQKHHRRFFWLHPYTRTLYWSVEGPEDSDINESSAKHAQIQSFRIVLDPNPMPPGLCGYSIVVSTPSREIKLTTPTKERHDIWLAAFKYLLAREERVKNRPTTDNNI